MVRTTNYLRDIERDYEEFNKIRTSFYRWLNLDPLPASVPDEGTLEAWAWESRPLLRRDRTAVARADLGTALAHKTIWPDFTVGLTYGQRDRGTGTERMGSAAIGFSVPVHAGARQYAAREEARASMQQAQADLSASRAEVESHIGVLVAEPGATALEHLSW